MSGVIDKVRALLARTTSPYEEEARTSAVVAARLIRDNGLMVVEGGGGASHTADLERRLMRAEVRAVIAESRVAELQAELARVRRAQASTAPAQANDAGASRRLIASKYDGHCVACKRPVAVGERVWWGRGVGVRCVSCGAG